MQLSPVIESLENRRLLNGAVDLGTVYSTAEAQFQSVDVSLQFMPAGPITATAGQTVTVQTMSAQKINVFCSNAGGTVIVDGQSTPATQLSAPTTYDYVNGDPNPDSGTYVTVLPGTHTFTFTILATALPEGITQSTAQDGVTPVYSGPWVVANGNASGSIFSSPLPFAITGTNHLVFTQLPSSGVINQTLSPISVAVENSSNQILDDNDSVITLAPDIGGIDTTEISGTVTATMVNGVATFNNVSILGADPIQMYAAAMGFTQQLEASGQPTGLYDPVGMFAASRTFDITNGGSGTGSSTLNETITKNTLPGSVVAGSSVHGTVSVKIANTGSSTESGRATLAIFASSDGTVDGNSIQIGSASIKKLSLRAGKSGEFSVQIKSLPKTLNGVFTLFAQVADGAGNTTISSTGPTLTAAAPFVAFSETFISATPAPADASGQKTRTAVKLKIANHGNIASTGKSTIAVYVSPDTSAADGTLIRSLPQTIVLKPGASREVTVPLLAIPSVAQGSYHFVVQVTDPKSDVTSVASGSTFML
jgi:hypothetical protein